MVPSYFLPQSFLQANAVMDTISQWFSRNGIYEWAIDLFNDVIDVIYALLGVDPTGGSYAGAWDTVKNLYNIFSTIGSPLLTIFFIYGFCRDTVDIKADLQFEATIKMFIRLIISSVLMNGLIRWLPRLHGWAISLLGVTGSEKIKIDSSGLADKLGDSMNVLVSWFFAIIFALVVLAACILMVWTCFGRFMNLYLIVPFATIALSTLAAGGQTAQTAYAYIKSTLIYTFEIVLMGIVLAIAPAFLAASSVADSGSSGWLIYVEALVKVLVVASGLKGSETVIRRALAL